MARSVPRTLTTASHAHPEPFSAEDQLTSPSPNSSPDSRPSIRLITTSSSPPASPSPSTHLASRPALPNRRRSTTLSAPDALARTSSSSGSGSTLRPVPRGVGGPLAHRRSFSEALSAAFVWTRAGDLTDELVDSTGLSSLPTSSVPPIEAPIPASTAPQPRKVKNTHSIDLLRRASTLFHPLSSSSLRKPLPTTVGTPHKIRSTPHKRATGKEKEKAKGKGMVRRWVKEKVVKAKKGFGRIRRAGGEELTSGEPVSATKGGAGQSEEGWENEDETDIEGECATVTAKSKKRPRVSGASTIRQSEVFAGGNVSSPFSPSMRNRKGYPANLSASLSRRSTIRRDPLPSSSPSTHSFRFIATSARKRQRLKRPSLSTSTTSYSRFVEIPKREGSVLDRPRPVERSEALRMRMSLNSLRSSVGVAGEGARRSRIVSTVYESASARIEEPTREVDEEDPLKDLFGSSDDEVGGNAQIFPVPSADEHVSLAPHLEPSRFVRSAAPSPASIRTARRFASMPAGVVIDEPNGTASELWQTRLERTKATRRSRRNDALTPFSPIDASELSKSSSMERKHRRSRSAGILDVPSVDLGSSTNTIQELTQVVDGEIERASWRDGSEQEEEDWTSADEADEFGRGERSTFVKYRDFATPIVSHHGDAYSTTESEVGSPYKDAPEDDSILFTSPTALDFPDPDSESESDVASALVVPARRSSKEVVRKGSLADLTNTRLSPSPTSDVVFPRNSLSSPTESKFQISPIQPISPFKFGSPFKKVGELISVHEEKVRLSNVPGGWSPRSPPVHASFTSSSSSASVDQSFDQPSSSPTIRTYSSPTPAPPNSPTALTLSPSSTLSAALLKKTAAMVFATPPAARDGEGLKRTVRPGSPASKAKARVAVGAEGTWEIYEDEKLADEEEQLKEREVVRGLRRSDRDAKSAADASRVPLTDKENLVGVTRS
ncbi:hypothetical protein NBRC10512_001858 [Rhodotorula toruloides]|uniref:RHTO0S19e01376g1_1 n=2 Tax=Rhodotorula toruloides TaxID=5286 RepID=A0A061BFB5_RHOTO|nr:uncharacterized protein RHTO_03706 [Rhodotorula toruloides NP11]EMS20172.1 hypothetical protein RHTO_03706 [Rhodotorula toruloides NP11]CDR48640.1 RHTO0S19e01376g1_1 [Rhodotorula toruloides]